MPTTNLGYKHAFLSSANAHILNLLLNLIQKDVLERSDILLILDPKNKKSDDIFKICQSHNIDTIYWEQLSNKHIKFQTLNSISLQKHTARIVNQCIDKSYITAERVNILITDDEVNKWYKLYNEEGELTVNSSLGIDEEVIRVLDLVDNYIVPYTTWGKPLENLLNRKLNIIDTILPFSVLDYKAQEKLEDFLSSRKKNIATSEYKILLFTKYLDPNKVFNIVSSYLSQTKDISAHDNITLGLWLPLDKKGTILYNLIKLLLKLKKSPIKLRLEQPVSSEQYALMLYEYDCLILQERGGFSTAKYFAENIGKIITLKNSFNDKILTLDYGINTFSSDTYIEALKEAISSAHKNEEKEIIDFANMISTRQNNSLTTLRNYWNSFK